MQFALVCIMNLFQYLFRCDHVLYTVVPVAGLSDIEKAYVENSQGVSTVFIKVVIQNIEKFMFITVFNCFHTVSYIL